MQTLDALLDSYLDLRWHFDPVAATAQGVAVHDHRLGGRTDEDVLQYVAALKAIGGAVEELDVESLDDEVDRTALLGELRSSIHIYETEQPHARDPGLWVHQALEGLSLLLLQDSRPQPERAAAAAERVRAVPEFLQQARATLRECSRPAVESARRALAAGVGLVDEVSRSLAPEDDPAFSEACTECLGAIAEFAEFLEDDLLDGAPATAGIGEEAFNFRLHYQHALRLTAPEVWRYGTALLEQTEAGVAAAAHDLASGFAWPDVADRLRREHAVTENVVEAHAAAVDRARRFVVERGLATLPAGDLRLMETPAHLRPTAPVAAYQPPGAYAADRTGRFYVTPGSGHCAPDITVTAVHEAIPGHHLQFLVAQAQERPARRVLWTPLTVEGWALYCEEMMVTEGFLAAPEELLFQKIALLVRACRVVLDVGLHTRGMTFQEGVELMTSRAHLDRARAEAEVRRCAVEPTAPLAYAVGLREVLEVREACERAWGDGFSLRRFHDAFLRYGGLPVSLIRWGMGVNDA